MASPHAAAVLAAIAEKSGGKVAGMREHDVQVAVFRHLATRAAPGVVAFHPANGGSRNRIEAARLRGAGVVPGVPDVIALHDGRTFALELKRSSGGRVSPAQSDMLGRLAKAGAVVSVACGLDEAIETLERWGLLRRSSTPETSGLSRPTHGRAPAGAIDA